jgi:hypothetical protein
LEIFVVEILIVDMLDAYMTLESNIWASQEQPREVMGFKSKVLAHFGAKSNFF